MKKLILNKQQYETAKDCLKDKCIRDAILEYMHIYNTDYDITNKILNAVQYDYKYLEIIDK